MQTVALPADLQSAFLGLAEERFGLASSDHVVQALPWVVQSLQAETTHSTAQELYTALESGGSPDLLELFGARLSVGETHFFRVSPQIGALRDVIFPDLLARVPAQRELRIWSAGCSTGEEPYTLAIL